MSCRHRRFSPHFSKILLALGAALSAACPGEGGFRQESGFPWSDASPSDGPIVFSDGGRRDLPTPGDGRGPDAPPSVPPPAPPVGLGLEPQAARVEPDQPFVLKTRHHWAAGADQLALAGLWIDRTPPAAAHAYFSAHGQVKKQGSSWAQYGMRFTGAKEVCGLTPEPRHCYKNYVWDVGGHPVGGGAWLYFNHDETLADTAAPTANSIGRYRAKAVRTLDATTIEVEWEVVLGKFFLERDLLVFVGHQDAVGASLYTENRPYWHEVGHLRVAASRPSLELVEDFEEPALTGWTQTGKDSVALVTKERFFTGKQAVRLESVAAAKGQRLLERDLGRDRQGVVTAYFYDDLATQGAAYFHLAVSNLPGDRWNDPSARTLALAVKPDVSAGNYVYRARVEDAAGRAKQDPANQWMNTGIQRTLGWHKVVFWVTDVGAWAELDDETRNVYPYNLASLSAEPYATGRRQPIDPELTRFRYVRFGVNDGARLTVDRLHVEALPLPPDLTQAAGTARWNLRFGHLWLDSYEELGMFGNLERWTQTHVAHYQGTTPRSWWWLILVDLAQAHYARHAATGLPFDRDQGNKVWRYVLANYGAWDDAYSGSTHASVSGTTYIKMAELAWDAMPDELRTETWRKLAAHFDWFTSADPPLLDAHVGDSSGEDFAWGPLYGLAAASKLFASYPNAGRWLTGARAMGMRVFSHDANEACAACTGGRVGIQTVYAPKTDAKDCTPSVDPTARSQSCLCPGDRGVLPANHDFSYLFDNHDYHPHPGYALGALAGLIGTINFYVLHGVTTIPTEFFHNLANVWYRHREYLDYRAGLFKGAEIYRLREKWRCDGDPSSTPCGAGGTCASGLTCKAGRCVSLYYVDRGPYDQVKENSFRQTGRDDWGAGPGMSPNYYLSLRRSLAAQGDTTGTVFQGLDLVARATQDKFYKAYDRIDRPVPTNLYFSPDKDLYCDFQAPHCLVAPTSQLYVANRLNARHTFVINEATKNLPLAYCEEPLVKERVWEGSGFAVVCDTTTKNAGGGALRLSSATPSNAEAYSTLLPVEGGRTYRVDYQVRTAGLVQLSAQLLGRLVPAQYGAAAKESGAVDADRLDSGFSLGANASGTTGWVPQSYTFTTQAGTRFVRLRAFLGGMGTATGTAWFDAVSLTRVP